DLGIAFTETPGRFVCAVPASAAERFAAAMATRKDVAWHWIGEVTEGDALEIVSTDGGSTAVAVAELARAWRGGA
ncbi:MAG: AIR synthase-related protein, partial [Planctomycetia bacterium]